MKVALIKDSDVKITLSKIASYLNNKCSFLSFEELRTDFSNSDEIIKCYSTHRKYLKALRRDTKDFDWIILVTNKQYDNNFFYDSEDNLIIISFFAWKYLTDLSIDNGLVYFICALFITDIVPDDISDHTQKLGCVNDFLYDKTRVDYGMKKGHLCPACTKYLRSLNLTPDQKELLDDIHLLLKGLAKASKSNLDIVSQKETVSIPITKIKVPKPGKKKIIKPKGPSPIYFLFA